jgi:hypothetical protein
MRYLEMASSLSGNQARGTPANAIFRRTGSPKTSIRLARMARKPEHAAQWPTHISGFQ